MYKPFSYILALVLLLSIGCDSRSSKESSQNRTSTQKAIKNPCQTCGSETIYTYGGEIADGYWNTIARCTSGNQEHTMVLVTNGKVGQWRAPMTWEK